MRVRDLGALAIAVDADERPVAGLRATAMLALLTINANRRVSVDALTDAAWGERADTGAGSTLETHIWRLRQLLEPGRRPRQPPTVLVNDAGGYRLVAGAQSVDSLLFGELAGEVRDLLAAGQATAAVARADTALALWRGRPFGPLAEHPWARPAVARLDELHGQVAARRIEALVETAALDQALSDLEPLIEAMPFHEPLRAWKMLALYRSGRGEQALQCYRDTCRLLADEVGTEPGAELRTLHQRILDHDAALDAGPRPRPARTPPRTADVHLPAVLTPLIGRDDVVAPLRELVTTRRLVTVTGAAGCGKTRVAVEVARAAAAAFPDGVWFVDLTAVSDQDLVVDVVISTIGFVASASATPLEDLGSYLRGRRVLLVLDNCEHVLPAVARIVGASLADPGAATLACTILATSREPLGVAGETIWTLDPLRLPDEPSGWSRATAPAVELFLQRLGAAAPTLAVDEHVLADAVAICVALDGLPLPIELAAARARSFTLGDIAGQVTTDPGRLGRLGRGPADHRTTVRSAIEWSHQLLTPPERVAHRRIAVLPGPFTPAMAAAVIGDGADVDDVLAQLVHRSLLASDGARRPGRPSTFRQLATVRAHARHTLADAGEDAEVTDRRDAWTLDLVAARPRLGRPEQVGWFDALDDGYATVRATLARHLIEQPGATGARLAACLSSFFYYRTRALEGTRWLQLAGDVVADAGPAETVPVRLALASAMALQGRIDLARTHLEHVVAHLSRLPPDELVDAGERLAGLVSSAFVPAASRPEAVALVAATHEQLTRVVDRAGDPELALVADAAGCVAAFAAGRWHDAVRDGERVHERAAAAGNIMAGWVSAVPGMLAAMLTADPDKGVPWFARVVGGYARLGTGGIGSPLEVRANFAAQAGDHPLAVRLYAASRTENRRAAMPWPRWELTRQLLDRTRERLAPAEYRQAWRDGEARPVRELLA
jgi:predicted ATPase/DNA-binding SARP family transcriptional activator